MAARRTKQEWQTLLERYKNSNVTQPVLCEQNRLYISMTDTSRSTITVLNMQ